jgi:deoxyribodipyrimidine photo-lyase
VPDEYLFEPWKLSEAQQREAGMRLGGDYPEPVVDHRAERERAMERYRRAAGS